MKLLSSCPIVLLSDVCVFKYQVVIQINLINKILMSS